MSEEQLAAFLTALNADPDLKRKLRGATDLDAVAGIAKEAGFDVSKQDWLAYQAQKTHDLSEAELEEVAGGMEGLYKVHKSADGCCLSW